MPFRYLPAGISLQVHLRASHKRTILETIPISPGKKETLIIPLPPAKRGEYKGNLSLLICDPFSLFKGTIFINKETTIIVNPKPTTPDETLRPLHIHSDISSQKKENSEDLYEVRKYYPGDDPRKINWKMFSHSGELFLRMGESGTPQKKRIFTTILLDSTIPPSLLAAYHDQLLESFLGFLTIFQDDEKEIFSILPGEKDWTRINLLSEYTPALTRQALIQNPLSPSHSPSLFPLPDKKDEFFILAPPDSSLLSPLLMRLGKEDHSCHLFIQNYIPQFTGSLFAKKNGLWQNLFFTRESNSFFVLLHIFLLEKTYLKKLKTLDKDKKISLRRGYVKKI